MSASPSMQQYYADRAAEYESIYAKPERQTDLAAIEQRLVGYFAGRRVLEIACGTGYWTERIARRAAAITGIDSSVEVLDVARAKGLPAHVRLLTGDAYAPGAAGSGFDAGFAGFWWSHVPVDRAPAFLDAFHACLAAGAVVALLDNRYVEGSSTPVSRRDAGGNTYQTRRLRDGREYEVLKNFPARSDFERLLAKRARNLAFEEYPYYWIASYTVAG